MDGRLVSGLVQGWQGTSLAMETTLTAITWCAMPVPFQIWSVGCLVVDAFIMLREMFLRPVFTKQQPMVRNTMPQFNLGMMM